MTDSEKDTFRQELRDAADIQADMFISVIESLERQLPHDVPTEEKASVIQGIIKASLETVKKSTEQLASEMAKMAASGNK